MMVSIFGCRNLGGGGVKIIFESRKERVEEMKKEKKKCTAYMYGRNVNRTMKLFTFLS